MFDLRYLPGVVTLRLNPEQCDGCGMCTTVCPHAVFRLDNGKARIADRDACMECGACARNCHTAAISVRAGVGCAAAVILGATGNSGSGCCCDDTSCCQP